MKHVNYILILSLFFLINKSFGQEGKLMPIPEIRKVIKLAIDLPELQQYYHVDTDSTRIPLIIKEYGLINPENMQGINKFGKEVLILKDSEIDEKGIKNYLNVGDWTYGGTTLKLQLSYIIEGILINYRFEKKDGKWIIVNYMIIEEQ